MQSELLGDGVVHNLKIIKSTGTRVIQLDLN